MEDKEFWKSKTIWGFAIAGVIAIGKVFNIPVLDSNIGLLVGILTAFLGAYGLRSAVGKAVK